MRNFLNDIRKTDKNISVYKQTRNTGLILLAGINVYCDGGDLEYHMSF